MRQFTYPGLTAAGILLIILGATQAAQTAASQPNSKFHNPSKLPPMTCSLGPTKNVRIWTAA